MPNKENYFDSCERGEYSIDPRDLVPVKRHTTANLEVIDLEGFRALVGEWQADKMIAESRELREGEEMILAAA